MKHLGLLVGCAMSIATFGSAATKITSNFGDVPIDVEVTAYCAVTNVDTVDFNNIELSADPLLVASIPFDVEVTCPDGEYSLTFDGDETGYQVPGELAKITVADVVGGVHAGSDIRGHKFTVTGGVINMTFFATLRDETNPSLTPDTEMRWVGEVPFIIESQF